MSTLLTLLLLSRISAISGAIYVADLVNNEYNCYTAASDKDATLASSDYCIIRCNVATTNKEVQCGPSQCIFLCNTGKCFEQGVLYGSDASTLSIESTSAQCMLNADVHAPRAGDLNISIPDTTSSTVSTFKGMTIYDGVGQGTNSIIINCSGNTDRECKEITINAKNTKFLKIIGEDNAEFDSATINCPENSDYAGPELAPCIIDARGQNVDAENMNIYTINGSPKDVVFMGSNTGSYTGSILHCDRGTTVINGNTFEGPGDCWIVPTEAPTTSIPTIGPTLRPTTSPTPTPTPTPTDMPTLYPSKRPTDVPSISPSLQPTNVPTLSPITTSNTPTVSPTLSPITTDVPTTTDNPTRVPTNVPTSTVTTVFSTTDVSTTLEPSTTAILTTELTNEPIPGTDAPTTAPTGLSSTLDNVSPNTSQSMDSGQVPSTTDNSTEQAFEMKKHSKLNLFLFFAIFIGLFVLVVLCVWCIVIIRKDRRHKAGELSPHEIISQDLANASPCVINMPHTHMVHIPSVSINLSDNTPVSIRHILGEGRLSQYVTPEIPEMHELKEAITAEELVEIKRKYNKKKSTNSSCDYGYYEVNKGDLLQLSDRNLNKDNDMDREDSDSEELYDENEKRNLERYETPKFGHLKSNTSDVMTDMTSVMTSVMTEDNSSTPESGHPTKVTRIGMHAMKTPAQWM